MSFLTPTYWARRKEIATLNRAIQDNTATIQGLQMQRDALIRRRLMAQQRQQQREVKRGPLYVSDQMRQDALNEEAQLVSQGNLVENQLNQAREQTLILQTATNMLKTEISGSSLLQALSTIANAEGTTRIQLALKQYDTQMKGTLQAYHLLLQQQQQGQEKIFTFNESQLEDRHHIKQQLIEYEQQQQALAIISNIPTPPQSLSILSAPSSTPAVPSLPTSSMITPSRTTSTSSTPLLLPPRP